MSDDLFNRYGQKENHADLLGETGDGQYAAYGFGHGEREQNAVRLYDANGWTVGLRPYALAIDIISTSHQFVSIIYTDCIITLHGKNLDIIIDVFQDRKLRWLQCFNPHLHPAPPDDTPVIERIERENPAQLEDAVRQGRVPEEKAQDADSFA